MYPGLQETMLGILHLECDTLRADEQDQKERNQELAPEVYL